jgi:3-dehydroquinate synthase
MDAQTISVALAERAYDIRIGSNVVGSVGEAMRAALGGGLESVVVVSNSTVWRRYGDAIDAALRGAHLKPHLFLMGDGERFKTLRTAERLWDFCIERRIERGAAFLAVGGGVVGDLTGFAAATYLRGVPYVQFPTTLLAQIDSSVGGKTAVNRPLGKNLVGAFHQPALVVIDVATLRTLPRREWNAGWHEAIKYGVIRSASLFETLERALPFSAPDAASPEGAAFLIRVIAECCRIKAAVVANDEREAGERRILNFGHTVGHALEAVTGYRVFRHGEAVGVGMIAACEIAVALNVLPAADAERVAAAVHNVGRLPSARDIAPDAVLEAMTRDKKATGGKIRFILPRGVGDVGEYPAPDADVIRRAVVRALAM